VHTAKGNPSIGMEEIMKVAFVIPEEKDPGFHADLTDNLLPYNNKL